MADEKRRTLVIATFRVARLTLQTRIRWLVGVATRPSRALPLTCLNVKNSKFFFEKNKNKFRKMKNQKKTKK